MIDLGSEFWRYAATLFLYFVVYSVAGYILEVSHSSSRTKVFYNRGYLFGPYCPIYGFGAVFIILATMHVSMNPFFTFLMSMAACSALEYVTSFLMEKIFNMRWWDYTKVPYNLNGRVCLRNSIIFGLGGMVIVYITQPAVAGIIAGLSDNKLFMLTVIFMIVMGVDTAMSTVASLNVKKFVAELKNDSTRQIKKLAKEYYEQRREVRRERIKKLKEKI